MTILAHAPIEVKTDFFIGRQMYGRGIALEDCTSERMRSGWLIAENVAGWAEFNQLQADRRSPAEVEFDEYLEAYRASPVVYLGDEQMAQVEDEQIGMEHYEHRCWW